MYRLTNCCAKEILTVLTGQFKITSGNNCTILNEGDTGGYRADVSHCIENLRDSEGTLHLTVWFPK